VSLFYVCFLPLYFVYGGVQQRDFSAFEMTCSWIFFVLSFVVLPVYAALKRKFWITAGLAAYGLLACLPVWFLPGMAEKLSGDDVSIVSVLWAFILRCVYAMTKAPFAALTPAIGDVSAAKMPLRLLPLSLLLYIGVKLFRFYRDAYVQEQLDPASALDKTSIENSGKVPVQGGRVVRQATMPEVLGTVISAPDRKKSEIAIPGSQKVSVPGSDRPQQQN